MADVRIKSRNTQVAPDLVTDMYQVLNTHYCTIITHNS